MPEKTDLQQFGYIVDHSADLVDHVDQLLSTVYPLTLILQTHPDPQAYAKLVAAIDEIVKTWEATDTAFGSVWRLFNPKADLYAAMDDLMAINDHALIGMVEEGRGHCHLIAEIYWVDLRPYFEQALSDSEQQTMGNFFEQMGNADMDIFRPMLPLAEETERAASEIIDLVFADELDEARQAAQALLKRMQPLRKKINQSLAEMKRFQKQFVALEPEEELPTIVQHITVGDIINSTGIAIGDRASALVMQIGAGDISAQDELQAQTRALNYWLGKASVTQPDDSAELFDALNVAMKVAVEKPTQIGGQIGRLQAVSPTFATTFPAIVAVTNNVIDLLLKMTS